MKTQSALLLSLLAISSMFVPHTLAQPAPAAVAEVMTTALEDRDKLPAAVGSLWRFEGPRDVTNGGRVNEIAIHPVNSQIMYATGATGGAWKTTDGGITWAPRSTGWPIQSATAVAIDPNNGNRVFVGTGDYKRIDHVEPFSVGIMRSVDGGLTWANFGSNEMHEFTVSRIVVDPSNSKHVLAATGRGSRLPSGQIFRSTDGGVTWTNVVVPDANWDDLELCSDGIFWASATRRNNLDGPTDRAGTNGLLYQSLDGGTNWSKVTLQTPGGYNLDNAASRPDLILIACQPDSSLVFVAVYENATARVFVTSDAGASWQERTPAVNNSITACGSTNALPIYPLQMCYRPWEHSAFGVTANFVYVGGVEMYRGGFVEGVGFLYSKIATDIHGDFQSVVPDPAEPDAVFLTSDGGAFHYSPNAPATNATKGLSKTLNVAQIFGMDVHKRHGGLIGTGEQDNGTRVSFATANATDPPVWGTKQGGDGRKSVAFRHDGTVRIYLANTDGRIVRYDGTTLTHLQGTAAPNSQAALLFNNDTLYYADTQFWQLVNPEAYDVDTAPVPWTPFPFHPAPSRPILTLAVCPANAQVIYAGGQLGEIYSNKGGTNWSELDETGLPTNAPIWAIAPANCGDVLVAVGYENGIAPALNSSIRRGSNTFYSGDRLFHNSDVLGTGTWVGVHGEPALPRAPLYAIVRLPSAPSSRWFVAGDVGVFRTDDSGGSWANATGPLGLPNTLVRDLRLSGDGNTLYAATFGRGVWSMDVNPPAGAFGVRGTVTQSGRPVSGALVAASGAGRIMKFLKNTLTTGTAPTTAPIEMTGSATVSSAAAAVTAVNAASCSLVTPGGSSVPMSVVVPSGTASIFFLSTSDAAQLVGQATAGDWSFKLVGHLIKNGLRLSPSVLSAVLDLRFTNGVREITAPNGEYTLEYLSRGAHTISVPAFDCGRLNPNCLASINLQANLTGVDFRVLSLGEFSVDPGNATLAVHDLLNYAFTWTVPEPLNWHDLNSLQLRIRDDANTIFWVFFDEATKTFSLVNSATGQLERGFAAGSPNRLQTPQATLHLADTSVVGSGPTGPSVTLNLALSFKPSAAGRTFLVEVAATDDTGNADNFAAAGTVTVAPIQ
jgi:photosystem II stability/assembly factor-like uncharacterized protein